MKLFNKGKRVIGGIAPQDTQEVDKKEAAKLLSMYGSELIKASDVEKEVSAIDDKAFKQLQKEVAELEALLKEERAKVVELEDLLEASKTEEAIEETETSEE